MLLSEYVAEFFAQRGVRHAFVISGGASIHLLHAFHNNPNTMPVCPHHEQAAAMAADGYARATGNLGVAIGTSGPGAMNMITGIAGAWFDSVPCVYLTGQVTTFRLKGESKVRQFGFQETDILPMVEPITKYCVQIRDASRIRYELEKAVHIAKSGRPGPVLLDIPDDLQRTHIDSNDLVGFSLEPSVIPSHPDADQIDALTALITKSERPVLVFGWGVHLSSASQAALALADKWQMPILTTWGAKDIIPADHPLCVGVFGTHGTRTGNFTVQNADLVVSIGARLSTRETGSPLTSWAREADTVIVDIDAAELEKFAQFGRPITLPICADAMTSITTFEENCDISGEKWTQWMSKIRSWQQSYPICDVEDSDEINPYNLMNVLSDVSPDNAHIFSDTGCAVAWLMQGFRVKSGQRTFHDFNNTAMGWGLPAAIGGALALPETPVICVVGDGSFMMNIQELATLKHHNLSVKVILLDNSGYSMVRQTEEQWLDGLNVGTSDQSGLSFPEYKALAESFGLPFMTAEKTSEIRDVLRTAMDIDGPSFAHIKIPPDARVEPQVTYGYAIEDPEPHLPREEFLNNMIVKPHPKSLEAIAADRMLKTFNLR